MAITLSKQSMSTHSKPVSISSDGVIDRIVGVLWFFVSFFLFVVLGPFSAPIALIALLQQGCEDRDLQSPESVV